MAAARLMAVVVLPTPPFWLATVRMAVIECPAPAMAEQGLRLPGPAGCKLPAYLARCFAFLAQNPSGARNLTACASQRKQKMRNRSTTPSQVAGYGALPDQMRGHNADEFPGSNNFGCLPKPWKLTDLPGDQVVRASGIGAFQKYIVAGIARDLQVFLGYDRPRASSHEL